ncbi:DCC1-like thiol-disulfide oxidoreductase family protein [Reichenbachiella agarivorans]|uniref:DCC1-like thiol-disulfide oxidoreductase family protein n=1 Tax=Reichenbachiella agarivorans TaxID=2979464 RepID=A0ABY6CKI0_9BACT|nr:DCC1-like thiol-disulfide oxidoreductase family protein [Reichenbachiella agarivorans]UXP31029.1 DCC1-like thiol-disulfide oxidoreductase family protein [Reichenbachiella agarivorans]
MGEYLEVEELNDVLLYDGVCKFCNSSVSFVLEHEKNDQLKFTPLQSDLGVRILTHFGYPKDYTDGILFLSNGKLASKSRAALYISKFLKRPWSWLQVFWIVPLFISDFVYNIIARNRYKWFGMTDACMLPPRNHKERFLE